MPAGGVPARGGACQGGVPARGGACQGGVCLPGEGGCLPGGYLTSPPPKIWSRHPPPVDRMTHACENITLAKTSFRPVNITKMVTMAQVES